MNDRRVNFSLLLIGIVAAMLCPSFPVRAGSADDQAVLDAANVRWKGTACRTRYTIELEKKKGTWARCRWLFFESGLAGMNRAQILVSDAAAVHRSFPGGVIPAGTELEAIGLVKVKKDVALELESPSGGFRLRVLYLEWKKSNSGFRRLGMERLDQYEAWVRYDFLDVVASPSEGLVDAPVQITDHRSPAAPVPAPPANAEPVASAGPPSVEIVSVAVQPARVAAGASTDLIVTYTVGGVSVGAGFEVVELREIFLGEQPIASFEERLQRTNGTHPSRQSLTIPAGTAPGVYTLRVTVVMAGREVAGSALFEVARR